MANYPGSLPSATPVDHRAVNDEVIAIAAELDIVKANGDGTGAVQLIGPNDGSVPSSIDYWVHVEIEDDGSDSATWPDRLAFYFEQPNGTYERTGYHNEYGELRSRPAKDNTTAMRAMGYTTDPYNINVFEVASHDQTVLYLGVSPTEAVLQVPVHAPNIGAKVISLALGAPIPGDTLAGTVIVRY